MMTESRAAGAASFAYIDNEFGGNLSLPDKVGDYSDVRKKARSKSRDREEEIFEMYYKMKKLLEDFDSVLENVIEGLQNDEFSLERDYSNYIDELDKNRAEAKKLIKIKEDEAIENYPGIIFDLKNYDELSSKYFDFIKKFNEDVGIKEAAEEIDFSKLSKEDVGLGMFLGLEPYMVVCLLKAEEIDDEEFVNSFQRVFDEYSYLFTTRFEERFDELLELDKIKLSADEVSEMVESTNTGEVIY